MFKLSIKKKFRIGYDFLVEATPKSFLQLAYSGDLNSKLVWYSNGPKQFVPQMVCWLNQYFFL